MTNFAIPPTVIFYYFLRDSCLYTYFITTRRHCQLKILHFANLYLQAVNPFNCWGSRNTYPCTFRGSMPLKSPLKMIWGVCSIIAKQSKRKTLPKESAYPVKREHGTTVKAPHPRDSFIVFIISQYFQIVN